MNLKLRFAFFFTLFVAFILFVSFLIIYLLYSKFRKEDFYARLRGEGINLVNEYKSLRFKSNTIKVGLFQHSSSLYQKELVLVEPDLSIIYKENNTVNLTITKQLINAINKAQELKFRQNDYECLGIYFKDVDVYVISAAIDKTGRRKKNNLLYILIGVFGGGISISAFLSFFIVQKGLKPLTDLNNKIQEISLNNLGSKIYVVDNNDELGMIANSFNEMLERLNEGVDKQKTFVQHASHELRTPLATMLLITEAALNRDNNTLDEYKQILTSLQEEQLDLIELTNSLLVLSQIEKINSLQDWPFIRLDELLFDSIETCKKNFSDAQIHIEFTSIPESQNELTIQGNDALLKSAIKNLVKNAYLYSANKKVEIIVKPSKTNIEIEFINNGLTLTKEEAKKISISFFRGNNASNIKGFGLGLSIVNRTILMHRGRLDYTITEEGKNKFTMSFKKNLMVNNISTNV